MRHLVLPHVLLVRTPLLDVVYSASEIAARHCHARHASARGLL